MKIELNDGTIFVIDEDSTSIEFIDKFIRIMKYMTFGDITIANGLMQNLYDLSLGNKEVQNQLKEFINEIKDEIKDGIENN